MKKATTQPQRVMISALVKEVTELYEKMAAEKNCTLRYKEIDHPTVWADQNQFSFIVRNLVHNAIKFSPSGSAIQIEAHNESEHCIITVTDTGQGMSNETLQQLYSYDPMISKTGTAGEEGTGLGLRICLEFAHLNHGQLTVKNNPYQQGSCFTLRLPIDRA
jgi:signal transduction histidine kinase